MTMMMIRSRRQQQQQRKHRDMPSLLVLVVVLLLSFSVSSCSAAACQVTDPDGADITSMLLVDDADDAIPFVNCTGDGICKDVVITDCQKVLCRGVEACSHAHILNVTHSVACEETHACHYTEIKASTLVDDIDEVEHPLSVRCDGFESCDVADIQAASVRCLGSKACRKATIRAGTVQCLQGSHGSETCSSLATFEVGCLVCGTNGCGDHINMCRYHLFPEDMSWRDTDNDNGSSGDYLICPQESSVGACSEVTEDELDMELHGEEDHDEKDGA
jgi:hypothetical protein